jgi:F0F1-type ATP synthase assembly protein I
MKRPPRANSTLKLSASVIVGLLLGTVFFTWAIDEIGWLIWHRYPGYPYVIYLAIDVAIGIALAAFTMARSKKPFGIIICALLGFIGGLVLAPFVLSWIIMHA